MDNTPLQLTIREMKQMVSARFLAGLLGVVCILTVSAPFRTAEVFNTVPLFFYWGVIAISTCFLATFVTTYTTKKLEQLHVSRTKTVVIANLIAASLVALLVCFINFVIVGVNEFSLGPFLRLAGQTFIISLAVSALFYIVSGDKDVQSEKDTPVEKVIISPFLKRLPKSLGTDIISLRAQDHYVEVTTTLGRELILIRLSDAIAELGSELGIQTHRSWWVVRQHVLEQKRVNSKPHLLMSNGFEVPVSRTYGAVVKKAIDR